MADLYSIKTSPLCVQNAVFREKDVKRTERERAGGRWREAGWKRDSSKMPMPSLLVEAQSCWSKHGAAVGARGFWGTKDTRTRGAGDTELEIGGPLQQPPQVSPPR